MIMRLGITTIAACFAIPAIAQGTSGCVIPPAMQANLANPPRPGAGYAAFRSLGYSYLQIHCLDEAEAAYRQMREEAKSLPDETRDNTIELSGLFLEFVNGLRAAQHGDYETAFKSFSRCSNGEIIPTDLSWPAATQYAKLMMAHFNPTYWPDLKAKLEFFREESFWLASAYLVLSDLNPTNAETKISEMRSKLEADQPIIGVLIDKTILIDMLIRTGRLIEADILMRDIEEDIGNKAWNRDLRTYYLQLCVTLSMQLSAAGIHDAAVRLPYYQRALEDLNAGR